MDQDSIFFADHELDFEEVEPGKVSRKVRARGGRMMAVEVFFETGGIGYEHEHPHEQICYCLSGESVFTGANQPKKITAGDSVYVPAFARHGAACLNAGRLLDVFTPQREEFLNR